MSSLTDILTAVKNIVTALNSGVQGYLNVNAAASKCNLSAATVVKSTSGRLATVSILSGGSAVGYIYDSNSTSNTSLPLYAIPTTVGLAFVNLPFTNGLLVAPGTGQTVTVGYS